MEKLSGKALATGQTSSPSKRGASSVSAVLDLRMSLSEAIEAAGNIIRCYPHGGANAGDGYIGAIAATLGTYPKQVAAECANAPRGIVAECKFMPTVADIVGWCERYTEPLRRQFDRDLRIGQQLRDRKAFIDEQSRERERRLTIEELKEKYGDWTKGNVSDRPSPFNVREIDPSEIKATPQLAEALAKRHERFEKRT